MAINAQGISLTNEKLQILYCSVRGVLYDLVNVFIPCKNEIFVKLNLPIFLVFVRHREKSQKFFDLSSAL